jgi:hypothetical protein
MSELFREALRHYVSQKPPIDPQAWRQLLEYGRARGRALGISNEADVERMSDEYRVSKQA